MIAGANDAAIWSSFSFDEGTTEADEAAVGRGLPAEAGLATRGEAVPVLAGGVPASSPGAPVTLAANAARLARRLMVAGMCLRRSRTRSKQNHRVEFSSSHFSTLIVARFSRPNLPHTGTKSAHPLLKHIEVVSRQKILQGDTEYWVKRTFICTMWQGRL